MPKKKAVPKTKAAPPTARATAPVKDHIEAVAEVDLKGYKYGVEPTFAAASLDLVFILDCTGSMGSTIAACQKDINSLTKTLRGNNNLDVRVALIPYRDHHLNEKFCTKVYPFTRDLDQMQTNVNSQYADGGGDTPEAVTAALFEGLCLEWRGEAAKQIVIMADAGPHGLSYHGDQFPGGDPDGKDPLSIAREMESLGITVYSLLTSNSMDSNTTWFFGCLSTITGGNCVRAANSNLLKNIIIEGATDAVANEEAMRKIRENLDALRKKKGRSLTKSEEAKETARILNKSDNKKGKAKKSTPASGSNAFIVPPDNRLTQARNAQNLMELKKLWHGAPSGGASSSAPPPDMASRITAMREAREARSTDKVIVECVAEGKKIRARIVSSGYDTKKNVQFPSKIREVGKRFVVDMVVDAGSFYRVKGNIVAE